MAKFMVLLNNSATAKELMTNASQEDMKAAMGEWMVWHEEANKIIKVEFGLPLQIIGRVAPTGQSQSDSQVTGYLTAEANSKDEVMDALANHPHLKRDNATIDLFEMISMPGM